MSKNIKILTTVVPNPYIGYTQSNDHHFSVFFSPRLPENGFLYDYYEICHWDRFIESFIKNSSFYLQFSSEQDRIVNNKKLIHDGVLCRQTTFENGFKVFENARKQFNGIRDFEVAGELWKSLFNKYTPVKGWYYEVPQEIKNIGHSSTLSQMSKKKFNQLKAKIADDEYKEAITESVNASVVTQLGAASIIVDVGRFNLMVAERSIPAQPVEEVKKDLEQGKKPGDYKGYLDIKKYKSGESKKELEKQNQEFHKKFSILSQYPDLLRATGWIVDFCFELDLNKIPDANVARLQIIPKGDINDKEVDRYFKDELEFSCPWTAYNNKVVDTIFSLRYKPGNTGYFKIEKGFVKVSNDFNRPNIVTRQRDKKREIMDIISTLYPDGSQVGSDELQAKVDTQIENLINKEEDKFADKISTGIGIVIENSSVGKSSAAKRSEVKEIKDSPELVWGEDLDVGYRIDVYDEKSNSFRSLCKRKADYYVDIDKKSNKARKLILSQYYDEPWVAESAQVGLSGDRYIHEEICRWNNWSLTCPHTVNDPEIHENSERANNEYNDLEVSNIRPGGKLIPLRFGKDYKFRLRIVDICGNGPGEPDEHPRTAAFEAGADYEITAIKYQRIESIAPPELFFTRKDIYKTEYFYEEDPNKNGELNRIRRRVLNDKYKGEDLYTMVIKSYDEAYKAGHDVDDITECSRIIAASRVTPHFAEVQGAFDEKISKKEFKDIYDLCKGKPKEFYDWSFWNRVRHPSTRNTDDDTEPIGSVSGKIDYVTDRDIEKINLIEMKSGKKNVLIDYSQKSIFDRPFERFTLKEWSHPSNTHDFSVEKGEVKPWLLQCNNNGSTRMLTMIHAVQKPLVKGLSPNDNVLPIGDKLQRLPNDPAATWKLKEDIQSISFPSKHSGEFRLIATYNELVVDTMSPIGYRWQVSDEDDRNALTQIVRSFPNYAKEESITVDKDPFVKLEDDRDVFDTRFLSAFDDFRHTFPDTKFRSVNYELKAFSKFRDFFSDIENEDDFAVTYRATVKVLNSAKPKSLVINKIIPVFSWIEKDDTLTRLHNKFRVYFDDDQWYTTGAGEGVAVIIMKSDSPSSGATDEDNISSIFTQLGTDPIQKNDSIPAIQTGHFIGSYDEGDVKKAGTSEPIMYNAGTRKMVNMLKEKSFATSILAKDTIINESLDSKILTSGMPSDTSDAGDKKVQNTLTFNYVVFPVLFENEEVKSKKQPGKFYVEIEFDGKKTDSYYFPFIKFALSRYQENSIFNDIYDYRFSNVIMTSQMQVLPKRSINTKDSQPEIPKDKTHIRLDKPFFEGPVNPNNHYYLLKDRDNNDLYLEEYEFYQVDGKFSMNEDLLDYTPRNDIRKRLVFSYRIKNN